MKLNKKYQIISDKMNVMIQELETNRKTKATRWITVGYFNRISQAFDFFIDLEVKATGMIDLATVVKKQEELHALITKLWRDK